jgi:hypothetical protein
MLHSEIIILMTDVLICFLFLFVTIIVQYMIDVVEKPAETLRLASG